MKEMDLGMQDSMFICIFIFQENPSILIAIEGLFIRLRPINRVRTLF